MTTNLDHLCARMSQELADALATALADKNKAQNHLRNSLGVLMEQGIYAFALYQQKEKKRGGDKVGEEIFRLLKEDSLGSMLGLNDSQPDLQAAALALSSQTDLNILFLAQDLIASTLTYALYHLKAQSESTGDSPAPPPEGAGA